MARTNKRGIAAKKSQQQKQAKKLKGSKRFEYPQRKLDLNEAKELGIVGVYTNPGGRTYHRFLRGRKICRETRLRVDGEGYRYVKTPSGGSDIVQVMSSGRVRKKLMKNARTAR
jgi:hypothetical protein